MPAGFQIVGRAFDEAAILAAGHAYQNATAWHLKRPPV
jgi:Asp-tRNA(Asn)/Glu-tRNA(Gln) amidotransferase A subunit family amidase